MSAPSTKSLQKLILKPYSMLPINDFFEIKSFRDLSVDALYDILNLRLKIFVVEQNCVYLDTDYLDQNSEHVSYYVNNQLVAYVRIIPISKQHENFVIGRVVCDHEFRNQGIGKKIMQYAIDYIGLHTIKIGAQLYLKNFYESIGFQQISEVYDLDGIPHIDMKKHPRD